MSHFDRAFTDLLGNEGGYSNNPADPGGETMWGVTIAIAREDGYMGAMRDFTQASAKIIYRKKYWLPQFDELPYGLAFQLFDGAVNSGIGQSIRWLQRALGEADDGKFGPVTMAAALKADPIKIAMLFSAKRLIFMTQLTGWASFGKGWARRIAENLERGCNA